MYIGSLFNTWKPGENNTKEYVILSSFESSTNANNKIFQIITKCIIFIGHIVVLLEKLGKCVYYYLQIPIWFYMVLVP